MTKLYGNEDATRAEIAGANTRARSEDGRAEASAGTCLVGAHAINKDGVAAANAHLAGAGAAANYENFAADAAAEVGNAEAEAICKDGRLAANAHVAGAEASAGVGVGIAGIDDNLRVGGKVLAAGGGAEADLKNGTVMATAGASLVEGQLGPLTARVGLKFGGGICNGVPFVDLGPFSIGNSGK